MSLIPSSSSSSSSSTTNTRERRQTPGREGVYWFFLANNGDDVRWREEVALQKGRLLLSPSLLPAITTVYGLWVLGGPRVWDNVLKEEVEEDSFPRGRIGDFLVEKKEPRWVCHRVMQQMLRGELMGATTFRDAWIAKKF